MTKTDDNYIRKNKKDYSSSNSDSDSDSESEEGTNSALDIYEYNKLLAKTFPSKYMDKKLKRMKRELKNNKKKGSRSQDNEDEYTNSYKNAKKNSTKKSPSSKIKKNMKSNKKEAMRKRSKQSNKSKRDKEYSSSESNEDTGYSSEDEYELDSDEEDALDSDKFNIIFTLGNPNKSKYNYDTEYDSEEEFYSETDDTSSTDDSSEEDVNINIKNKNKNKNKSANTSEDETETSNSEHGSDTDSDSDYILEETSTDSSMDEDENQDEDDDGDDGADGGDENNSKAVDNTLDINGATKLNNKSRTVKSRNKLTSKGKQIKDTEMSDLDNDDIYNKFKELSTKLLKRDAKNKNLKNYIKTIEKCNTDNNKNKKKNEKKAKKKNLAKFRKQIRKKNSMNDYLFFSKLSLHKQSQVIKELDEINNETQTEKPYRLALLESQIPKQNKAEAYTKIKSLRHMDQENGEYYKLKNWVETFMRIPFGIYSTLPVRHDDGIEKCDEFIKNAKQILDDAVYGLDDAKLQIIQLIGQWMVNPDAMGTAIAIHGPPGTGKTSLVKEGISKILNRAFAFTALGGAGDQSLYKGHNYTYEGSTHGRIVSMLIQSKMMNPIMYFDELDKISNTQKGDEVTGVLTHLTDTTQNSEFHDNYFAEITFDLSKVLYIFSYNDESAVNPVLLDRMYKIETKGYDKKEKIIIALDYLLPKIREQIKFSAEDIIITDDIIGYIIEEYTDSERGVRSLKRCLEILYTKLNLYRLMKPGSNIFKQDDKLSIEFPLTITREIIDAFIKKNSKENPYTSTMYM